MYIEPLFLRVKNGKNNTQVSIHNYRKHIFIGEYSFN